MGLAKRSSQLHAQRSESADYGPDGRGKGGCSRLARCENENIQR